MNVIHNENNLLKHAKSMNGYSINELSVKYNIQLKKNTKNKGYLGNIIENFFGLQNNNKPIKDFYSLGIELKTIPINDKGIPLESTFICSVPLIRNSGLIWNTSYVRYKINRILWIPIEKNKSTNITEYRVKYPFLWSPNYEEEKKIKTDWNEIMDMVVLGKIKNISSQYGEILFVKTKANSKKNYTQAIGEDGQPILTIPKGFYLRKKFTYLLLNKNTK